MSSQPSRQKNLFETAFDQPAWEIAAAGDQLIAEVVLALPMEQAFSYGVPEPLRDLIQPGQRVEVPFGTGNRIETGFCVRLTAGTDSVRRLKTIHSLVDRQPLANAHLLELTRWIADRYLCSWGQALETAIPAGVKNQSGTREITFFTLVPDVEERLASIRLPARQQAVIDLIRRAGRPLRGDEITEAIQCSPAPIQGLRDKGLIQAVRQRTSVFDSDSAPVERIADLTLNSDQKLALSTILLQLRSGKHRTLLLHGVTGSGKTEVYIQAIREVVGYGRQAIVLVPEISLTPQTIRRFRSRFDSVAVLHSHLTDAERHWHWQRIARGDVQVVVGARSAVFAPVPQLGLVIIDEEHETSFKQDTTPRYHAREVARERTRLCGVPLILGTATPTLESWWRVLPEARGTLEGGVPVDDLLISLPRRVSGLPMPPASIVDLRNDPLSDKGHSIGRALRSCMQDALAAGGQVILFLNLRGYSPTVWCRKCSTGVRCPECDITLTFHKDRNCVMCHSCGFEQPPPTVCPQCGHAGIRYFGTGTQRLEQEVIAKFPQHRVLRMDSDTMQKRGSHDEALSAFQRGEAQILVGTQMIAKGLDFPNVTLVGVIDADTVLHQPDMRSSERTFQLIAQVAGRAGRSEKGGRVLVQTCCPQDVSIQKAVQHDFIGFAKFELQNRREAGAPPFQHWVRVILRGPVEEAVKSVALDMADLLRDVIQRRGLTMRVLGPAPCPVTKLKGQYRYHFQLSAVDLEPIRLLWRELLPQLPADRSVEFVVDVDPINLR